MPMESSLPEVTTAIPAKVSGTLLFVDDEQNILSALRRLFRPAGYNICVAASAAEGLQILESQHIDLVVSDMRMPQMDGAEFLKRVAEMWPNTVRILLTGYADLSSTVAAINDGQIYRYVSKPWEDNDLKLTIQHAMEQKFLAEEHRRLEALTQAQNAELAVLNASLEAKVKARTAELEQMVAMLEYAHDELRKSYHSSIRVFANLIEMREGRITGHSRRVADLARKIALKLGLDEASTRDIVFAALLHDLGKLGWSDELISKPFNTLTGTDMEKARTHPVVGQAALMALEPLHGAATLIRSHHERFDGKGFPDGLAGDNIPMGARVIAIANDFDALLIGSLTSQRLSRSEALDFIIQSREKRYDPRIVDLFVEIVNASDPIQERQRPAIVRSGDLKSGMVLAEDLFTKDGVLLLSKDYTLDEKLIRKVRELETELGCQFDILVWL